MQTLDDKPPVLQPTEQGGGSQNEEGREAKPQ
jgi:hypothetical protein